ncbi:ATP-dependent RNA helicase Cdc28 [Mayamaea pseudoterrestris]|nr:ATP-dependent RNA helicase Cdc28 [Mayamaea pseudoterrestris]
MESKKRRLDEHESSTSSMTDFQASLPVHQYKQKLIQAILQSNKITLIVAETGSGKSTQIPAYILNASNASVRIAVTQPRRVAAMTLAKRVAIEQQQQQQVLCGSAAATKNATSLFNPHMIGYRVRFEDTTTHDTRLVYVTDGMLLRESMVDPLLRRYSVVFLDESHERSLQTDILLGVVQRARLARMKLNEECSNLMSATLDVQVFTDFFGADQVHIFQIPGRQHFVQTLYTSDPVDDYMEAALFTICEIHEHERSGDILVFLPGQEEIEDMAALLRQQLQPDETRWIGDRVEALQRGNTNYDHAHGNSCQIFGNVMVTQLYAALPPQAQVAAFDVKPPHVTRKVILATTIAETSITLPDICYVVDCGKHKCRRVLATGMETLNVEAISQAQAMQRAGRAGRVAQGLCFRLYPEVAFGNLEVSSPPEITRVNLSQVVLQLKGMGIQNVAAFEFVTPPSKASLKRAIQQLYALSALDDQLELTDHGKMLAKLPLDPVFGNLLIKSAEYSCVSEMLTAVSVLSAENLFYRPPGESTLATKADACHKRFASYEGDLPTFLNVYDAWRSEAIYVPPGKSHKSKKKLLQEQQKASSGSQVKISHSDWCQRNYVSGRALSRAYLVRQQLRMLCEKPLAQNGLELNVTSSCGSKREVFLKAVAAGLYLQAASRIKSESVVDSSQGRSGSLTSNRGKYQTKFGSETVSIHPTSTLFGRNPAPACVVYTELIHTKRTYIRGVSQIREEWLEEVAPRFFQGLKSSTSSSSVASTGSKRSTKGERKTSN